MPSNTPFRDRMEQAKPVLDDIVAWLWHEAEQRVANRSHGEMSLVIKWDDGFLRFGDVGGRNVIKPGKPGKLPGTDLDPS